MLFMGTNRDRAQEVIYICIGNKFTYFILKIRSPVLTFFPPTKCHIFLNITIIQQDAAVGSQFYFTAALLFRKLEGVVGTGWSWLRIGTGGGHLWVR